MAYTREQRKIQRQIVRIGQRRLADLPVEQRRQAILSALATGGTESRWTNPEGGDRDSGGWRQERRMYYRNPTNVRAAANRYYDEWLKDARGKGLSVGLQAQAVQQSGFPDRFQGFVPEAKQILRRVNREPGGPRAGGAQGGGFSRTTTTIPGVDNSALRQQVKLDYLDNRGKPGALLELAGSLQEAKDVAGKVLTETARPIPKGATGVQGRGPVRAAKLEKRADRFDRMQRPYVWGGGHGATPDMDGPWDCSGAVSALLGINPRVSGQFQSWGKPGRGKFVTVYANPKHVLIEINGKFWGTSGSNPGGGAGWIPRSAVSASYLAGFTARHPG